MNGFRNCHAHGVHSIALGKKDGRMHRVFIAERDHNLWQNSPFSDVLSVGFHSHHCDLKIRVLAGQIGNLTLTAGASRCLAGYRYQSALRDGSPEFLYALPPAQYGIEEQFIEAGGELDLPAEAFHTVWVARDEAAAWLVEEGEEDPYYLPITLSDADLNVFDWTGMYQPLSEAECADLLRRYVPELLAAHAAGQFADSSAPERAEADLRATLAESATRARIAEVRLLQAEVRLSQAEECLSQATEHLVREVREIFQVKEPLATAGDCMLVLFKENEAMQREIDHLRRDAAAYDSRINALLNSEHALKEEVAALRRRDAERASDPEGLEDIARQARNNFTEADLDALNAHRAALCDAGDSAVSGPLSMVLAAATRLIRWENRGSL